jgi:hypothetical protein
VAANPSSRHGVDLDRRPCASGQSEMLSRPAPSLGELHQPCTETRCTCEGTPIPPLFVSPLTRRQHTEVLLRHPAHTGCVAVPRDVPWPADSWQRERPRIRGAKPKKAQIEIPVLVGFERLVETADLLRCLAPASASPASLMEQNEQHSVARSRKSSKRIERLHLAVPPSSSAGTPRPPKDAVLRATSGRSSSPAESPPVFPERAVNP